MAETVDDAGAVRLYLDLGDDTGRVVETTAGGWAVVSGEACPVRFVRRSGLLPLPPPVPGGSVRELRRVINAGDGASELLVAWLLCALRGRGPYPILGFSGEQGTGKSTAARYARRLVDPNVADLRDLPRNAREAYISAAASHVLVYDNVSTIQPAQSDVLCRLATGGGYAVRALHTDADEALFNEACPQILTGIGDIVTRPDLADRTLAIPLERIGDWARQTEADLDDAFEAVRSRVLGALLDAAADGLRLLPTTRPGRLPRLADAARWVLACEAGGRIGKAGTFQSAFDGAREELVDSALDADPVASLIRALYDEASPDPGETFFRGTSGDLLERLTLLYRKGDERRRLPAGWPQTPRGLSAAVTRNAPPLRAIGIDPSREKSTGQDRSRLWVLRAVSETERPHPSEPPIPSEGPAMDPGGLLLNGRLQGAGGSDRPRPSDAKGPEQRETACAVGSDGADGPEPVYSVSPRL